MNYIFIFSPYNSGTTIVSEYIASQIKNCYLPLNRHREGLKIPEVWKSIDKKNRWDTRKKINYDIAAKVWPKLASEAECGNFIEASPPNLCHMAQAIETFQPLQSILFISNPYHFIGSCINRYALKYKMLSINEAIIHYTNKWKFLSSIQMKNSINYRDVPVITYENFCSNPDIILTYFHPNAIKDDKPLQTTLKGKPTTGISEIIDMTPKYLCFLRSRGIELITKLLADHEEVLSFFEYKTISIKEANKYIRDNLLLANDGLYDRISWDKLSEEHQASFINSKSSTK
ncbi:hypothetical protein Q3Y53_01195 [Synechococcus sp. YX-04-1]|uniref:hypothetical protein n=1 Tax=Synechococcus sp. YX-04-1 TaxID=3062778 RepID=UPI0026E43836|nr:hypothetical protein [Synechococcus sp. YX-04-1]MDO6351145.1 hypothetical protein [Synechococcus sp. YX-04-1]